MSYLHSDITQVIRKGSHPGAGDATHRILTHRDGANRTAGERELGIYAEHDYTFILQEWLDSPYDYSLCQGCPVIQGALSAAPSYTVDPFDDAQLLSDLQDQWRSNSTNLAVTLGEGRETLTSLGNTARRIGDAARSIKRGNLAGALRNLARVTSGAKSKAAKSLSFGDLRSTWLSLRYGWVPLLSEIHGYWNLPLSLRPTTIKTVQSQRRDLHIVQDPDPYIAIGGTGFAIRKVTVIYKRPATIVERLGLDDPAAVAWELFPASFIADWAWPISKSLAAINSLAAPVRQVYVTDYSNVELLSTIAAPPGARVRGVYPVGEPPVSTYRYVSVNRRQYDKFPLHLRPTFRPQVDLSVKRCVDALFFMSMSVRSLR